MLTAPDANPIDFHTARWQLGGPWSRCFGRAQLRWGLSLLLGSMLTMGVVQAQRAGPAAAAPLVFRGVTVVDVVHGTLVPDQTVVIVGNRIQTVMPADQVQVPTGARVVDAHGKYLIPGLWDLHTHARGMAPTIFYPLFLANGVTGIRDAGSEILLDTQRQWRREILAGTRIGPPRQILSGPPIGSFGALLRHDACTRAANDVAPGDPALFYTCVAPSLADARQLVDSLHAAGVDMLKTYALTRAQYLAVLSAARQAGIPVGGHAHYRSAHLGVNPPIWATDASDSGVRILDHINSSGGLDLACIWRHKLFPPALSVSPDPVSPDSGAERRREPPDTASLERCRPLVERFQRNGTWWVPTMIAYGDGVWKGDTAGEWDGKRIAAKLAKYGHAYWDGKTRNPYAPEYTGGAPAYTTTPTAPDSLRLLTLVQQAGIPVLAGTDVNPADLHDMPPGFALHAELAAGVAEGLTPLNALQSATLNPAQMLHATDTLGTVAPGKLADLVLLDADPLADIANTTRIRAVVANGRYFDRAALDQVLAEAQVAEASTPEP